MNRNRFLTLLRFLHSNDNEQQITDANLYKITSVINHLRTVFGESLVPCQNLCIDESLVLWKGRLSFKQYIPSKRRRFGIKLFLLCDVHTGNISDFNCLYRCYYRYRENFSVGHFWFNSDNTVRTLLRSRS